MNALVILLLLLAVLGKAWQPTRLVPRHNPISMTTIVKEDFSSKIINFIFSTPLYKPIVNMARDTMVKTAYGAGLDWTKKVEDISKAVPAGSWDQRVAAVIGEYPDLKYPEYFTQNFHGYETGNLGVTAAFEQEIAGKAVGARNFPQAGLEGEAMLRGSYDREIQILGGLPPSTTALDCIVDMGCGTGTSTRRLAKLFPQAKKVIGYDLSPYMIAVGRFLSEEKETYKDSLEWVEDISYDDRISLQYRDMTDTGLPAESVNFVSVSLVMHELPLDASIALLAEASRILKPGGTLAIMEMDPDAPGYKKLRSTPWLFSILRSTEPHLDDYFNRVADQLPTLLTAAGFESVKISAATGRHFCIVAGKNTGEFGVVDSRPSDMEREQSDAHLNTMKVK